MPCGCSVVFQLAERIIRKLGIGSKRNPSAPADLLLSNDYLREQARQEIRGQIARAKALLEKRLVDVPSLEGRPVLISGEGAHRMMHLEFDTVYSGISEDGAVFVSSSDQDLPDKVTLLFMASKHDNWEVEPVVAPNLDTAYFRKIAEIEGMCEKSESA